jgi:1D-myo-inositol-tetrakisphosphate 5-kinase/inositol-polyphosphate multikinase
MMIENATDGMIKPCIMDIKIGAKTYGPDASEEKKKKQDASYAGTKKPFGFSVLGMSVYHGKEKKEFKVMDKNYGKSLNKDNINNFTKIYFDTESESKNTKLVMEIITDRLKAIEQMYSQQRVFHIFGSSILFVYDAAALLDDKTKEDLEKAVEVKMIDFAHVHPANGEADLNYNTGLRNLINLMENLSS